MTLRAALACSWSMAILVACWLPNAYMPVDESAKDPFSIPDFDKIAHAGIFAVFAVLWMWALPPARRARWVLLGGIAFAVVSEFGQELPVVGRDATWLDGLADVAGLAVGLLAYRLASWRPGPGPRPA